MEKCSRIIYPIDPRDRGSVIHVAVPPPPSPFLGRTIARDRPWWRENTSRSGEVERAGMDAAIRKSPTRYRLSLFQARGREKKRTICNTPSRYLSAIVSASMETRHGSRTRGRVIRTELLERKLCRSSRAIDNEPAMMLIARTFVTDHRGI